MHDIVAEWGGSIFFDGAHQLGSVAGGQFQERMREGAAVMTGSAGKPFSGRQSGIIVWDDQALTEPLTHAIFPVLAATHQVIADVRKYGGGLQVAQQLARANIITNKNLIPADRPEDWDRPGGLRMGTIEITRLGMGESEMGTIADFISRLLIERAFPDNVIDDVIAFRQPDPTLYSCFTH